MLSDNQTTGACEHRRIAPFSGGYYLVWREAEFEADTESEVKAQVEVWVAQQMADVIALLGGAAAFRAPHRTAP